MSAGVRTGQTVAELYPHLFPPPPPPPPPKERFIELLAKYCFSVQDYLNNLPDTIPPSYEDEHSEYRDLCNFVAEHPSFQDRLPPPPFSADEKFPDASLFEEPTTYSKSLRSVQVPDWLIEEWLTPLITKSYSEASREKVLRMLETRYSNSEVYRTFWKRADPTWRTRLLLHFCFELKADDFAEKTASLRDVESKVYKMLCSSFCADSFEMEGVPWELFVSSRKVRSLAHGSEYEQAKEVYKELKGQAERVKALLEPSEFEGYASIFKPPKKVAFFDMLSLFTRSIQEANQMALERRLGEPIPIPPLMHFRTAASTVCDQVLGRIANGIALNPYYWVERKGVDSFLFREEGALRDNRPIESKRVHAYPNVGTPLSNHVSRWVRGPNKRFSFDLFLLLQIDPGTPAQEELKRLLVYYFSSEELKTLKAEIVGGKLQMKHPLLNSWQRSGRALNYPAYLKANPLGSQLAASTPLADGEYIFVISPEGKLRLAVKERGVVNHSSLNHGLPVFGVGEIVVKNGKVVKITNWSGHYQNSGLWFARTLAYLKALGLDVESVPELTLERVDKEGNRLPSINLVGAGRPPLAQWMKMRRLVESLLKVFTHLRGSFPDEALRLRERIAFLTRDYSYDLELTEAIAKVCGAVP